METVIRELQALVSSGDAAPAEESVELLIQTVRGIDGSGIRGSAFVVAPDVRDSAGQTRGIYRDFAVSAALRAFSRLEGTMKAEERKGASEALHAETGETFEKARRQVEEGSIVERLWAHWLMTLTHEILRLPVDANLREALWDRATAGQQRAGHLHPLGIETNLDGFVFDELTALHAAANSALHHGQLGQLEKRTLVERVARYHLANTQPDNTTNQPWGLAAFAVSAETRSFAEQQVHDARTHLASGGGKGGARLAVALAADALWTLEQVKAAN